MTTNDIYDMFDMDAVVEFYENEYETEIVGTTKEEQLQEIFDLINTHNGEEITINGNQYTVNTEIKLNNSSLGNAHAMNLEDAITNETYLDILLTEDENSHSKRVWLATATSSWGTSITSGEAGYMNFGIYYYYYTVYSNGLEGYALYGTYDEKEYGPSYYLRPIVTLKSDVELTQDSEGIWQIN